MVKNHLRAPYGVYFHKKSYDSARPAAGRITLFFCHFLDIIRCPVKFSYYLKFHDPCTAFCRVIEGTMTSAGHCLHTWDGHRTISVWNSNWTISTAAGHRTMCEKSKELSKISIQIVLNVLWVELPPVRSDVYLQK